MPFTIVGIIFIATTLATALALVMPPKMILLECFKRKGTSNVGWNALAAFLLCSVVYAATMAIDKTTIVMRLNGVTAYPFVSLYSLSYALCCLRSSTSAPLTVTSLAVTECTRSCRSCSWR